MAKLQREKPSRVSLDQLQDLESKEINFHDAVSKGKPISHFEQDPYNEHQNFLYNRALFGLSIYTKEELDAISWEKKKRIIKVHKKAQTVINLWKQHIINVLSNHLFKTIFPDSPITKELLEVFGDVTDELHVNKMPLKTLKITKDQIIARFIKEGILPKNFNNLVMVKEPISKISTNKKEYANQEKTL